jgi:hypothetical protein
MKIASIILYLGFAVVIFIYVRRKRRNRVPDENYLSDELCNEARTKYPSMSLLNALDMLYRDYFDKIILARNKGEDTTEFIEKRQIIAQERAFLIVREQQCDNAFELTRSAQA